MDMLEKIKNTAYFQSYDLTDDAIDTTTKLIARKYILNFVTFLVNRDHPFTLCILDIDNFKAINDTYGHLVGDEALAKSAKSICDIVGDKAFVGRYGGDEFLLIIPDIVEYDDKWAILKKLHVELRKGIDLESGTHLPITATTGAASFPDDEQTSEKLFKKADAMLYRGKTKGRDRFIIYNYEVHKDIVFDIQKTLPENMMKIRSLFNGKRTLEYEIYEASSVITQIIGVDGCVVCIEGEKNFIYNNGGEKRNVAPIPKSKIDMRLKNHRIIVNNRSEIEGDKKLQDFLASYNIRSCLVVELETNREYLGYLAVISDHNRVWQDSEIALGHYLSAIISDSVYYQRKIKNKD
ncbi:MAG: diguanylate cyclase [Acholeplasmatales bacterium]|nr:diguanylate cyclase [Acholeplasmatales bacterium]